MTETLVANGDADDYIEEGLKDLEDYANPLHMTAVAPGITRHETAGIQKHDVASVVGPMAVRRLTAIAAADGGYYLG